MTTPAKTKEKMSKRMSLLNNWVPRWVRWQGSNEQSPQALLSPRHITDQENGPLQLEQGEDQLDTTSGCSALFSSCRPVTQSKRVLEDLSFDLVTPDGQVTSLRRESRQCIIAEVHIKDISSNFVGWLDDDVSDDIVFNLKSTLSQLGVDSRLNSLTLTESSLEAKCEIEVFAITTLGILTLDFVEVGTSVGKLFKLCSSRRVHTIPYITRLLSHNDRFGNPLLTYGEQASDWELKEIDNRVIAFIKLKPGALKYDFGITGFLPTVGKALRSSQTASLVKDMLRLHQSYSEEKSRLVREGDMLLVRSKAMNIRSIFARVVPEFLPFGVKCTASNILEPYDANIGRTFVLYGNSDQELDSIPIEFYTVEPYREGIAFENRVDLADLLMNYEDAAKAFRSVPKDPDTQACVYICKANQMRELNEESWISSKPLQIPFVGSLEPSEQHLLAQQYLVQQCQFGVLSAIDSGEIISQGVLLTKYFISPILKHLLLSGHVCQYVRAIYFLQASKTTGTFFSQTDRAMLQDLMYFGVRVYHVDLNAQKIYQYVHRMGTDSGMFVPLGKKEEYLHAVYVGIYGSNLIEGDFENDLTILLTGLRELITLKSRDNSKKGICVVTGGGPGVMELGNRVAHNLGILSCGLFVDFGSGAKKPGVVINEQKKNPYVDAWMTYRLEKLVERQSDFNLDFPIFCIGGIGTDFEFALEEVRRKVGTAPANPILLFGPKQHWTNKLTARWQENLRSGVVKGSEWLSNVCYVVSSGAQALRIYEKFFNGELKIGSKHSWNSDGFIDASEIV